LYKKNQAQIINNLITDIGNEKVYSVGNNYYIEREYKKSYPTQVVLVKYRPTLLNSIPVSILATDKNKIYNFLTSN
jgi:hypothetical protein